MKRIFYFNGLQMMLIEGSLTATAKMVAVVLWLIELN